MQESSKRIIEFLNNEIKILEADIEELMQQDNETYDKYKLLQQYQGVGKVTAMELVAFLPELGAINQKSIISLAGVAPHPRDIGTIKGYRTTKGEGRGRPIVKRILFMSALSATR